MLRLVPGELIAPLKRLGRSDWLWWTPMDTSPPTTRMKLNIKPTAALVRQRRLLARLKLAEHKQSAVLFQYYVLSKALAEGPKLLRPTTEQCMALEQVDVNVSFNDYEQPFSTFLLELPAPYRRMLTERFGLECPDVVVTHHDRRTKYIISYCERTGSRISGITIMSPRRGQDSIEDALRLSVDVGDDLDQGEVVQRIALNFGLLMTHHGARIAGLADPGAHARRLRNARKTNRAKAEWARTLLDAEIDLVEFEQDVVLHDDQRPEAHGHGNEGGARRTHWRRGHFRRQPFGPGRNGRKLVFIRPVLVNADQFHGDVADTEYRARYAADS